MSDVTPLRPENEPEDPFEALLDEESDEDFGYVVTRDRASSGDSHPVKLAEWKAQDFASIYTRFRPHLERHARRFLNNQSQVDEVVQDAFLYLMVSLPELDSEIGVLRFLKWKTRLLCLDVIRASGKANITNIDDVAEPVSNDPEVSAALEQQDDAAVIRLAMSKLNPRHREVLLASMYEEKTTLQIAEQVGLSENATRQLVFRARSAFKKALLGDDVNTEGMSAAAILSVAARKAAAEAKKAGAQAMVFALFLVLSVAAVLGMNFRAQGKVEAIASSPESESVIENPTPVIAPTSPTALEPVEAPPAVGPGNDVKLERPINVDDKASINNTSETKDLSSLTLISETATKFSLNLANESQKVAVARVPEISTSPSLSAKFKFDPASEMPISEVVSEIQINGQLYSIYPGSFNTYVALDDKNVAHYFYFGVVSKIFNQEGVALEADSSLYLSTLRIEVIVDSRGERITDTIIGLVS